MAEKNKEKKEQNNNIDVDKITSKMRDNPWIVSTIVLGLACIMILFFTFKPGVTGNVVSGEVAGGKLVEYLNTMTGGGVSYLSYEDLGNIYMITVSYKEQDIPVYCSKDGKYFIQSAIPITGEAVQQEQEETPKEVPKSDKPKVEAFVFSYCPYGLQFEKAILPVYKLLKNKADINIVFIGAMHGEYEKIESLRQLCIEKEYGKDKLFSYLEGFLAEEKIGNCNGDGVCLQPLLDAIMAKLSIDKNKIKSCMEKDAEKLYQEDLNRANSLGISGSPGFVINDVDVNVARAGEDIKKAVCSAFNQEPEECKQVLSNQQASPGFGYSASSSTSAASCG